MSSPNEKDLEPGMDTVCNDPQSDTFLEGGLHAWITVVGAFLVQFTSFGYVNAHGVFNDFYVREYLSQSCSVSRISWIGSVQLFFALFTGVVSGIVFDAGHFYRLTIGGSLLFVFSLIMISISQPEHFYQVFLPQGLGIGIATGLLYIPSLGIVSHHFRRKRALAMGIATTGSALGGAVHPLMLNSWLYGSLKFHSGVRASAVLAGGLLTIALLLMKPRYPKQGQITRQLSTSFKVFSKDIPYVVTVIGTIFALAGIYYPVIFIQLNAIKNGIDPSLAFYTIAILNGGSALGRVIPNILATKIGVFNIIIPSVYIISILILCTLEVTNAAGTFVFALLYGYFSGAYIGGLPAMIGSLAVNDAEIGARLGVCFAFTGFGGLFGTPIAGALLSTSFLWWRPTVFASQCCFIAATCFLVTRCMKCREKGTRCF